MTIKQQLAAELFCHTGVAIRELSAPGFYRGGIKQNSVLQFQQKWNRFRPLTVGDPGYPASLPTKLTEDAMYGPNTARCMDAFVAAIFTYMGITIPWVKGSRGVVRILPRRAVDVAGWSVQWRTIVDGICPTGVPPTPTPTPDPNPGPIPPIDPNPIQPEPTPEPTPNPTAPPAAKPVDLTAFANGIRVKCTPGFPNVFRTPKGKLLWVTDQLSPALKQRGATFVRRQAQCTPQGIPEDNTSMLAGIGLAVVGAGTTWWFWLRKKKKGKK